MMLPPMCLLVIYIGWGPSPIVLLAAAPVLLGLGFNLLLVSTIRERRPLRCEHCRYDLRGTPGCRVCPECGRSPVGEV